MGQSGGSHQDDYDEDKEDDEEEGKMWRENFREMDPEAKKGNMGIT